MVGIEPIESTMSRAKELLAKMEKLVEAIDPKLKVTMKLPKTLVHLTTKDRVESIKKGGIKLGASRATQTGTIQGVYLSDDPRDVVSGGDFPTKDLVEIEVSTKGLKFFWDAEFYENEDTEDEIINNIKDEVIAIFVYTPKSIPAKNIVGSKEFKR
jgi:hypothetical protein